MITRNNLEDVIRTLSNKDKKRILSSSKEYVVLYLHIFNAGCYATVRLTNDYNRYKNVWRKGNAVLSTEEVQELINNIS